jgi:Zn-dependent metalloprotease
MKQSSTRLSLAWLCVAILGSDALRTFGAEPLEPREIPELLQKLAPQTPNRLAAQTPVAEAPRVSMTSQGFLRSIGAPPGQHFPPSAAMAGKPPELIAHDFMRSQSRLFGVQGTNASYIMKRNRQSNGRNFVRLQQSHRNIPIVAAEAVVQVNGLGGVECVLSDLATVAEVLDQGIVPTTPALSADEASVKARAAFPGKAEATEIEAAPAELAIFDPAVLDEAGSPALVWDLKVFTADRSRLHYRVLVNAVTGDVVRAWTLNHDALNRQISDKNNNTTAAATVVRTEGQAATGIADVDNAYAFLGDTYNFYQTWHGRDSYDNAGVMLQATVRYCDTNKPCPWVNASSGPPMRFGNGWATDDIVAHEYTHNVTDSESGLIYTNASGAINESFSDIWGEFVDLSNSGGTDTAPVRWWIGEDLPAGAIRSMSFPSATNVNPNFNDPDRLSSPLYQQPSNTNDNGGVHKNSGVNNKLCYLLTDGDTFNGQTIYGNNQNAVALLYYEVQANLLTSGAGWTELYNALTQAAINLGWGVTDRNNLYRACLAVEMATNGRDLYVDKNSGCPIPAGTPLCVLNIGPYLTVGQGVAGANPGDVLHIYTGSYNEPMTIEKIVTLQTVNGVVTIGQ